MDLCADLMAAHMEMRDRGWRVRKMRGEAAGGEEKKEDVEATFTNPVLAAKHKNAQQVELTNMGDDDKATLASTSVEAEDPATKTHCSVLIMWFLIAMGNMAPWTAMMAFLGVFKLKMGDAIFLKMNAAYYGPALPVLLLQITFSPAIDRRCGSYKGFFIRAGLTTLVLVALMAVFPTMAANGGGEAWVLICSLLIGIFGGVAYGSIFSFNALFSKQCAAIFSMGLFAPGFAFLFFHMAISFSPPPPAAWKAELHWYLAAGLTAMGLLAFLALLNHPQTKYLLAQADRRRLAEDDEAANGNDGATDALVESGEEATLGSVAKNIGICLGSIFFSIFAIVSVTCFFTRVGSDGIFGASLPVVMFYVKNSTDFLGRCFTLLPLCINTQKTLGIAIAARFILVPLFFWYAVAPPFASDIFIIALIAVSGVTSGYLNTCCFVIAGKTVRAQTKSKAAGLMNLAFQAALLFSIGFGFALIAVA